MHRRSKKGREDTDRAMFRHGRSASLLAIIISPCSTRLDSIQTMDSLKLLLESGEKLQLYLDGGTREDLGSFGWELAVGRTILWTCMGGPPFGLDPGSFRAESYGLLSVILFLDHFYFRFFQVQVTDTLTTFSIATDKAFSNASTSPWIGPGTIRAIAWPRNTMCVESGIVDILHRLPVKFAFLHVKGHHQEDDTPVEDLPWEAQMKNCYAEAYATDYTSRQLV
jgi:hypothetical protein